MIQDILKYLPQTITGVSIDSRTIEKDQLFVGFPSPNLYQYCLDAYNKGVRYFLLETDLPGLDATIIKSDNVRLQAALLAADFYPKSPKILAAVTGTNGKSSTVSLFRQICQLNNIESASIGTLGIERSFGFDHNFNIPALTSVDAISLHKTLEYLANAGVEAVGMEASSHGLDQYRLDGATLTVAGFTNFTQDHLDYHKTMDAYFKAKAQLFERVLPSSGYAVLNADIDVFENLRTVVTSKNQHLITYAERSMADFKIESLTKEKDKTILTLSIFGKIYTDIEFNLFGDFQRENLLCAAGMAYGSGLSVEQILSVIPSLKNISGRMELVSKTNKGSMIFVDYAHTPDALENVLKEAKAQARNKVHVVFGCGGNRDALKRPVMGKIANDYADVVYVTNDNPRFEDDQLIRTQILVNAPKAIELKDRRHAIRQAIDQLEENDILIIAGKGHETGQSIHGVVYPFSDQEEVLTYVREKEKC